MGSLTWDAFASMWLCFRFPVGFPLKDFVTQCCPLQEEEKTACSARLVSPIKRGSLSAKIRQIAKKQFGLATFKIWTEFWFPAAVLPLISPWHQLEEMSQKLCASKRAVPSTVRRCCKSSSQETPQCISKIIMSAITKATNFSSQKKRKRCPIS